MSDSSNWLIRFVNRHPGLCLVLLVTAMVAPMMAVISWSGYCVVDYLRADAQARDTRAYWADQIEQERADSDKAALKVYDTITRAMQEENPGPQVQAALVRLIQKNRDALRDIVELEVDRGRAIEANPFPPFPADLCGLIKVTDSSG